MRQTFAKGKKATPATQIAEVATPNASAKGRKAKAPVILEAEPDGEESQLDNKNIDNSLFESLHLADVLSETSD